MNILNKLTSNYLKLNKKRTLVTIIGIILSGAMISAVTTLAVSFQNFMINYEKEQSGEWEAVFENVSYSNLKYIENNNQIKDAFVTSELYMAENEYSKEEYLRIEQYDEDAIEKLGEVLMRGELPKNSNEIALSNTFFDGKDNEPQIGDTITLNVGYMEYVKETQDNPYGVKFVRTGTKTYKITGIVKRPYFESYSDYYTGGITIMDRSTLTEKSVLNVGVIMKNSRNIYKVTEELAEYMGAYELNRRSEKVYDVDYNSSLLAYKGVNDDSGFNAMLYSVSGILIAIIMVGSIMVIYNSFAISISERKKQFGMLSSVGATRKQIRKSVIYEGAVLGAIGIPLGILSGIGGIWVTLKVVNQLLEPIIENKTWDLELVVSWPAIMMAVILIVVTIYMSVIIPARRASKITPIEAIRQTDDVKVKAKKLKTPKLIYKIFGMEGTIALKNLKRAKKRYRTTVISLVVSIVLYVSITGFVDYMYKGFDTAYQTEDYDYAINIYTGNSQSLSDIVKARDEMLGMQNMEKVSALKTFYAGIELPGDKLDKNIVEIINADEYMKESQYDESTNMYDISLQIIALNEAEYERYLKQLGIKSISDDEVILVNRVNLIRQYGVETDIIKYKEGDRINIVESTMVEDKNRTDMKIAKLTDKTPMGLNAESYGVTLFGIVSESGYNKITQIDDNAENNSSTRVYIKTEDMNSIDEQLKVISKKYVNLEIHINNVGKQVLEQKNLKLVIQIFLYGFIALISAIGISNIFNTISTNINLRRREFANLKSIGMTDKQFNRMLNLECIFYGTKALLFGLPIGVILCYLINIAFGNRMSFIFNLPWGSIAISTIAVYLVVFITMLYSSSKMKKENIIEALRDDNI